MDVDRLCAAVDGDRLLDLTFALVAMPSPTGQATACTQRYADHLQALGLQVRWETGGYPDHPSCVAVLPGGDRPTVQFDGHTDTVPLEHPAPVREADRVVGRGAADMKGSLAIAAELAEVFLACGETPPGDLMITAHDLHEAPGGLGETITDLARRGIHGDVAMVCEGGRDVLPVTGRGMAIFELRVVRAGDLCHEITGAPNPIDVAHELVARLYDKRALMACRPLPYVGPETIFLGQFHAGSFYNQVPCEVFLNGTWRFSPEKTFPEVETELRELVAGVPCPATVRVETNFFQVRPSFSLDPEDPWVKAVQTGYEQVHGAPLPLAAAPAVCDTPVLVREAGICTVGHGPAGHGAHGEPEWIDREALVRTTQVYLRALAAFWSGSA